MAQADGFYMVVDGDTSSIIHIAYKGYQALCGDPDPFYTLCRCSNCQKLEAVKGKIMCLVCKDRESRLRTALQLGE